MAGWLGSCSRSGVGPRLLLLFPLHLLLAIRDAREQGQRRRARSSRSRSRAPFSKGGVPTSVARPDRLADVERHARAIWRTPRPRRVIAWRDRGSSLRLGRSGCHRSCLDRDRAHAAAEAMCGSVHGHLSAARGGERLHAFRAGLAASLVNDRRWCRVGVVVARCDEQAFRIERELVEQIGSRLRMTLGSDAVPSRMSADGSGAVP